METPLRVLLIEDSESDAALIVRQLEKAGYAVAHERVETAEQMTAALEKQAWDGVIADYKLPQFDAPAALAVLQATGLDLPFVVVSGTIGEETAVALMKAGAHDYLMKNKLARLAPAIKRELAEAQSRRERRQAESQREAALEALRESEERFRALVENSADVIALLTSEGVILYESPAVRRVLGYQPAEMVGHNGFEFLHPDDYAAGQELYGKLFQQPQTPVTTEIRYKRKDDTWCWVQATGTNLLTEPSVKAIVINYHDITERKRAEEVRQQAEKHFKALIEHAPDGIALVALDGKFKYVSPSARKILGYSTGEAVDLDTMESTHPDDFPAVLTTLTNLIQNPVQVSTLQYRFKHRDGSWHWIESTFSNLLAEPSVEAIVINFRDIAERKRAEERRLESELMFRTLFDRVVDGILIVDMETRRFFMGNSTICRMLGYTPDELSGIGIDDIHPLEHLPYVVEQFGQQVRGEISLAEDIPVKRKDGSVFYADISSTSVSWSGHTYLMGVFHDITERKRAEEALREREERFRALIENSADVISLLTGEGIILYESPAVRLILGYQPAEMVGHNGFEFLHPDDYAASQDLYGILLQQPRTPVTTEIRYKRKDDTWAWVQATGTNLLTDPSVKAIVINYHDITERKQAENALRDKVATLQAVAEIDRQITAATESKSILELVCRRAAELVHAPKSAIVTRTAAAEMEMSASYGLRDAAGVSAEFAHAQQAGLMSFSVLNTREPLVLNDITADNPFMSATTAGESARTLVIVPLVAGTEVLGALVVLDTTPRQWQADDLQILDLLVGQTAIALEKLRLLEVVRSHALHLATLNDIGKAITSSLDLDRVLLTLLDKVREATEAEACSVALIDQVSGDLVFRQAVGGAPHEVIGLRLPPGEGLAGWVAQHRQSVLVPDAAADARVQILDGSSGFVTHDLIGVPLIARNQVTGVIELVNKRNGTFSEEDRRLLESVAAQATIAIENARLFETEHTARERLETLYRIGKAINSTLEADVILDRLTDEAVQATQATHGSALVAHPERGSFERRSLRGYSPEEAAKARTDVLPLERGVNGRAYRLRHPVYIDDVTADPDYRPLISTTRSELAVPIVRVGQVIGNLDLQSPNVNAFHAIDLPFLQALTDQVAIALENARLFAETLRQMDELTIVSQVALVGAAGRPFDETVARATDALSRLWPDAALGFLFVDESGQALRMHASYIHPSPEMDPLVSIGLDQGLTGWAVREQRPLRVGDVTTDPRYVVRTVNIRSEMVAPLVVGTQVIGVVNVETPLPDAFSGDDLRLLTTLAGQLAVIFEKARLDAALLEHTVLLEQRVLERTAEIHHQQARTQAILDALGEGVVVTDPQGVIQYVNPAMEQTTGFSAPEALGQEAYLWRSEQTPEDVYREMWATVRAGRTWAGEVVNRRKDGGYYFASLTTAPILTTDGGTAELAGVVSIQRDITERKRAEEEMRRALEKERELNTLKSNFVSLTSHEFRTPLTTILSSAEMIEHYGARWGVERTHEHLRRIQTSVKYMTGLLNDILVVGKAEADRLEFVPESLDLLKFCRGLVEEFELMDQGQHPLRFESSGECSEARMDEHLLRHIFSNLLSNALKYSPPGSAVEFEVTCQTGQAVFRIQDHGLGIPLEDQARLFETFHRARNVRNIAGTGLGLTIVKRSVDLHGGTIEVVSQVEVGTTVTVTLPLGALSDA